MAFIEHLCIGTESENLEDISGTCAEKKEKERKKRENSNSNESASKPKVERSSPYVYTSTRNTIKCDGEVTEKNYMNKNISGWL
jgi:hypothetical protein